MLAPPCTMFCVLTIVSCSGRTPLHWAAGNGKTAAVRELAAWGAPLNAVDANGASALHAAAFRGHVEVVADLLARVRVLRLLQPLIQIGDFRDSHTSSVAAAQTCVGRAAGCC